MRVSTLLSGLGLLVASYAAPLEKRASSLTFQGKQITHFLAFGDSYTFVDGTYGHYAYSFIGDNFHTVYTPEELMTSEIKLNSTSSGGPNWTEYLTGCFQGRPSDCDIPLWNFAFAGADMTAALLAPHHDYTPQMDQQIDRYLASADPVLDLPKESTLVAFWIGINDVNDSNKWKNVTFTDLYQADIDYLYESVEQMYDAGYKNFLFMNVPVRGEALRNNTEIWNKILEHERHSFNRKHIDDPDVATYKYDVNKEFEKILEHPTRYGFEDWTGYCGNYSQPDIIWNYAKYGCLPIDKYFWLNGGHVTYRTHEIFAADLKDAMA
ncbi:hypothetical protein H072_6343 [Dactylellina haptotyla CBS 200.50]|uniref:SGNH hydrolase-type esterase domain-containing protein n=1 Tax=Dactylellina haptotyla (strain CBS 200.50) TaxID=1284197 RepID=S8AA40_DACHA|nr:hypothetical protein H072_6343 [Dactylellina haptotyla CBS 200.50]